MRTVLPKISPFYEEQMDRDADIFLLSSTSRFLTCVMSSSSSEKVARGKHVMCRGQIYKWTGQENARARPKPNLLFNLRA